MISDKLRETLANDAIKMKLALYLAVSYPTISRWVASGNEKLTTRRAIRALETITVLHGSCYVREVEAKFDGKTFVATLAKL